MLHKAKLHLCYMLRHRHAGKSTAVYLRMRKEKSCTKLHNYTEPAYFSWLYANWFCLAEFVYLEAKIHRFLCPQDQKFHNNFSVFFNHTNHVWFCHVLRSERAVYVCLCELLLVFPRSCTGCGVCPILQLSAGQDTSLVQCVWLSQACCTLPGPGVI